ncbi:response regulator [Pelagicoccus sp. NFK12]|uniref:Sensory/regulatory protein RpfC n=1 Tax=Pelagicoccus enzymogenes TaxID=2773457 RepID=A0A927F8P8_9BACT|nr:ATP-binding protein [Pelagicoccus enzymogenes]MBD5780527.1 response regulator [Pelagicoccus enzymogenes]
MNFDPMLSPASREFELYKLMVEQAFLDGDTLLSEASEFFQKLDCRYAAVVSEGEVLGVCSRSRIGALLGSQFGFALHTRSRVRDFLEEGSLTVVMGERLEAILLRAFAREERMYWQDVVVTDQDGRYVGLLRANTLVRLQSELLGEKVEHLEAQKRALEETTAALKLSNQNLEKARDAGLQAARAKSEFLAVMSHEIRTPLNGVIGMMTLLGDSTLDAEQTELLSTANQSAEALLLILNDILDFSRLEAGKFELEKSRFEIRELVESVLTLMLETAHESGLEVVCDIDPAVPLAIESDSGRLRQVLANLLGNAVKFTEKGSVRVRVSWDRASDGDRLRFEIEDTGIGIPEDARARLFQPFMQADSSTTRRFGGTGLGLAICSQLATALGGEIGVESEVGRGSTFWFTIKANRSDCSKDLYPPLKAPREQVALVYLKNKTAARQVERELACRNIVSLSPPSEELFEALLRNCSTGVDLVVCEAGFATDLRGRKLPTQAWISVYPSHGVKLTKSDLERHHHVYLPIRPSQFGRSVERALWRSETSPACSGEPQVSEAGDGAGRPRAQVLVVEDNPVNRRLAQHLVKRFGHDCQLAIDGVEAMEICERQAFDLILLDCQMPRMDGYEFARRFREREAKSGGEAPRTPIVALTANAMQGDRELCFAAGMDAYLTKPLKKASLSATIDMALSRVMFGKALSTGSCEVGRLGQKKG